MKVLRTNTEIKELKEELSTEQKKRQEAEEKVNDNSNWTTTTTIIIIRRRRRRRRIPWILILDLGKQTWKKKGLGRFPFVRTDRPDPSRSNENFTFDQNYPTRSVKS